MVIQLYSEAIYLDQADQFHQTLAQRGVLTHVVEVEQINARFLRHHPEMALVVDSKGLWLSAEGMKMQPAWVDEIGRLKRATLKSEMIARACQLSEHPRLLDATAGLGHDSLLMAHLGAQVTLLERHPILFTLLESAHAQALKDPYLSETVQRMQLIFNDAEKYLTSCVADQFDVIYLDPMFPQRDQNKNALKKQAQVKKQMQLLHKLLPEDGEMDLGDRLLDLSRAVAKRVIVKRPRLAVFLADTEPQHQWTGDACRFDAYFQH